MQRLCAGEARASEETRSSSQLRGTFARAARCRAYTEAFFADELGMPFAGEDVPGEDLDGDRSNALKLLNRRRT